MLNLASKAASDSQSGLNSPKDFVAGIVISAAWGTWHYPQIALSCALKASFFSWSKCLATLANYKKPLEHSLQTDSCDAPKQGWKQSTSSHFARSNFSVSRNNPKTEANFDVIRVTLVCVVCVTVILNGSSTVCFSPIPTGAASNLAVLSSIFVWRPSLYPYKFSAYVWYFCLAYALKANCSSFLVWISALFYAIFVS